MGECFSLQKYCPTLQDLHHGKGPSSWGQHASGLALGCFGKAMTCTKGSTSDKLPQLMMEEQIKGSEKSTCHSRSSI